MEIDRPRGRTFLILSKGILYKMKRLVSMMEPSNMIMEEYTKHMYILKVE